MPENKSQYIVSLDADNTLNWNAATLEANSEKLAKDYPNAQVYQIDDHDANEEPNEAFSYIVNIGNNTLQWNAATLGANKEKLYKDYPDAKVQKVSAWQNPYIKSESQIAKENLDAFRAENAAFMDDYEARDTAERRLATATALTGVAVTPMEGAISGEERARYLDLSKQEEELKKAYYNSPDVLLARLGRGDYIGSMQKDIEKNLSRLENDNPDAYRELRQSSARRANPRTALMEAKSLSLGAQGFQEDYTNYKTAQSLLDDAIKTNNAPSRYDSTKGFANFFRGTGNTFSDADFWTAGLTEIAENFKIRDVLATVQEKLGNLDDLSDEAIDGILSDSEKKVLAAYLINAETQIDRAEDLSRAFQAGQGAAESAGFMAEFILTGGWSAGARKVVKAGAKKALGDYLGKLAGKATKTTVGKYTKRLAGDAIEAAARTLVMPSTYRNMAQQAIQINENPETGERKLASVSEFVAKGFADSFIEALAEGGRVGALGDFFGDVLGSIKPAKALMDKIKKSDIATLVKTINNTEALSMLRAGGWHGIGEEYLEEWYGAALRTLTNLEPEALKDFATVDNQLITLTSFIPMTLIGGTASTVQVTQSKRDLEKKAALLKSAMIDRGYTEDQANLLVDNLRSAPMQNISDVFTPMVNKMAEQENGNAPELMKAVADFALASAKMQTYGFAYDEQEAMQREVLRRDMYEQIGKFWQEDADGNRSVELSTLEDGTQVYILEHENPSETPTENGTTILGHDAMAVDMQGNVRFINMVGESQTMSLDDYLNTRLIERHGAEEERRMAEESEQYINNIKSQIVLNQTVLNMGTQENPVQGLVVGMTPSGVMVQTQEGMTPLSWNEVGNKLSLPNPVMTDAQIEEAEVATLEAQQAAREAMLDEQFDNPAGAEENLAEGKAAEQAAEQVTYNYPLKADGSVDGNALWNENVREWIKWNNQRIADKYGASDNGADSVNYLQTQIASLEKSAKQITSNKNKETDLDKRMQLEDSEIAVNKRLAELRSIFTELTGQEFASGQENTATTDNAEAEQAAGARSENATTEPAKSRERSVESEVARLYDMGLDNDEVTANLDAQIEKAQKALNAQSKKAPKMGADAEAYVSKKQEHAKKMSELQQELDFWNGARQAVNEVLAQQSAIPDTSASVSIENDPEPQNAVEFAARELGLRDGGIKLLWDSFKHHTGYGESERNKFFGLFRTRQKGGMTIEEAGERLMELDRENGTGFFDQNDPNAGMNAILDALGDNQTMGELRSYTARQRQEEAQREADAAYSAMMAEYEATYGETMEESAHYDEVMRSEIFLNALSENEQQELNNIIFAEEISQNGTEGYQTEASGVYGSETGSNATDVEPGAEGIYTGGNGILQETQSDNSGRDAESPESQRGSEGESGEQDALSSVPSGESSTVPAVESSLDGDMPDFTSSASAYFPNEEMRQKFSAMRARINEWAQKLGVQVRIMETLDDVVNMSAREAILDGNKVYGYFDPATGEVAFYLPDFLSINGRELTEDEFLREIDATYIHEVVSHRGLRGLLGEEKYGELCDKVWESMTDGEKAYYMRYAGVNGNTRAAADEYIAHLAEDVDYTDNRTIWDKIVDYIKELFDAVEIPVNISNESMADLLRASYNRLNRTAKAATNANANLQAEGNTMFRSADGSLVGMHNISEDKLRKVIKQGGLANPSTAVVNIAEYLLDGYGDISLIMPSSLVDPDTGDNVGTYSGDAWTPTYPPISRQVGDAGWKIIKDRIRSAIGDLSDLYSDIVNGVNNYLDDNRTSKLEFVFLKEKGIEPEVKYKGADGLVGIRNLEAILGVEGLREGWESYEKYKAASPMAKRSFNMWVEAGGNKAEHRKLREMLKKEPKLAEVMKLSEDLSFARFDSFTYHINKTEREAGKIDTYDTMSAAAVYVDANNLRPEFEQWLESLMQEAGAKEVFFAGYTRDGDRIYKDNTLENVSRHMSRQGRTNAYDDKGLSATKSALLERFTTLAQIRRNKSRLRDERTYNKEYDALRDRLYNIISQISDMEAISSNPFLNLDYAESRLQDALTKRNPIAYLNKEYGYKIDPTGEFAEELKSFIKDVQKMPAKYFETKFERPVYLNEFAAAVMPTTTSEDVKQAVTEAGLPIFEYDSSVEGSRKEATLKATEGEGIRFRTEQTKNRVESLFNDAIKGTFRGKPVSIGTLTAEGKQYLESISGLTFKNKVDFMLNASDLVHVYNEHFGANEKDPGSNIPLTIDDIRNIVDVILKPERVLYLGEDEGKRFAFLAPADSGAYNLIEVYTTKRGNLSSKTFYKTKKGVSHRAMILEKESKHSTSKTNGATLSDAKIPILFDITNQEDGTTRFRITPEEDKAYMAAVESGDMETAQRMVIEAAKLAMPYTKVVDENGNPKVVYHGTGSKFYTFRKTNDSNELGAGYYFSDSYEMAERYATDETLADNKSRAEDLAFEIFTEEMGHSEEEYDYVNEETEDDYNEAYAQAVQRLFSNGHVKSVFLNIENPFVVGSRSDDLPYRSLWQQTIDAHRVNDGIIDPEFTLRHDMLSGNQYVAFSPSQIKSAEPVTYDDAGNVIPLSERFNEQKSDIRFRASNENQAIFVSNAARAVEGIKQEKATPEQWLKMIEKSGGLKAGEDKWMGLSDWLKASDKKTLTKQEVLDFVNENMIVIDEEKYVEDAEENAREAHSRVEQVLQEKFDSFQREYYESTNYEDFSGAANDYAIEKLREEMEDTFPYAIENSNSMVYLTFPYEETDDLQEWADKLGVTFAPQNPINYTRLGYTTDGLINKREIALTVPSIDPWGETDDIHFGDAGDGRAVAWIRFGETYGYISEYATFYDFQKKMQQKYFPDREISSLSGNDLMDLTPEERAEFERLRSIKEQIPFRESRSRRVLVIDEIQSKRHQKGREKGYSMTSEEYQKRLDALETEGGERLRRRVKLLRSLEEKYGEDFRTYLKLENTAYVPNEDVMAPDEVQEWYATSQDDIDNAIHDLKREKRSGIPDAPFDKNWHELAMKRMLRYAAENGYDVIAWTKGEQQAERYNIGNVIDSIYYGEFNGNKMVRLTLFGADNQVVEVNPEGKVVAVHSGSMIQEGMSLADIVGKEIALKIMNNEGEKISDEDYKLSGEGLRVGGEGMKGFYDKILPAFMNKYGKKWGVKVEDIALPALEDGNLTMHSVPVTEEMKESVMEGQVMFRARREDESAMEFTQSEVDAYYTKYNDLAETIVSPVNEKTVREHGYTLEELKKIYGQYEIDKDRITIFAQEENYDGDRIEISLFHESIHKLADFYPYLVKTGEWMINNADRFNIFAGFKDIIVDEYEPEWHNEEMLCYILSASMNTGVVGEVMSLMPQEYKRNVEQILKEIGYDTTTEGGRRKARRSLSKSAVSEDIRNAEGKSESGRASEKKTEGLTIREQKAINDYFPTAFRVTDTNGNTLTPAQEEFFADSKTVDKDGNLLVLYHGTPRAGFTEFKSAWFTTSKEDAISYSGDRKGRMFDPEEKYVPETLKAGDFPLGYMTFDSAEDREDFLKRFPSADKAMSESEYEDARMQAEGKEYDALTDSRSELQKIWKAYREYERDRFVDSTIGDLLNNPDSYTEDDFRRAMLAYDSNVNFDSIDEMDDASERKDTLIAALNNANEETEGGILSLGVETRVPRNGEGVKHNDTGARTYETYVNIERPLELDAKGRSSEGQSGDIYKAVREAMEDDRYDGVIIRNWRVGRYQQLGDVVVPKNGRQVKLTSNESPTQGDNVRFRVYDTASEENIRYRTVTAQETLDRLNSEPTIKVYRAMQVIDGKLYPPMSAKVDGKLREPIELGQWEEAEERPDLADDKGRFKLDKGNKTSVPARYNPYFHTSRTPLNDQFSSAQDRPNLVTVEVEIPESELTSGYKAEKAKDSVGEKEWKAGVVQGKLSGTRKIILSRWDKPIRIVPDSEVADRIVEMFEDRDITMPSNVVTPSLRAELEKRGVPFVVTNNNGKPVSTIRYRALDAIPTDELVTNGLQLTPAQTAELAGNVFAALPEESRKKITDGLNGNTLGLQDAILQIPARLAAKEEWNDEDWDTAKAIAREVQKMIDTPMNRDLHAREGLWMLYDATHKSSYDIVEAAQKAFVKDRLGFSERGMKQKEEDVRFRAATQAEIDAMERNMTAADLYNRDVTSAIMRLRESFQDMYRSVQKMIDAIVKKTGKDVKPFENIMLALNQLSSKNLADKGNFLRKYLMPMWDAVLAFKEKGYSIDDVTRYVMLKHGLERNDVLAQRDARNYYKDAYDKKVREIEADKSLSDTDKQKKKDKAKADYDFHLASIESGSDAKYRELRERDYGAVMALYSDYVDIPDRMPGETIEQFNQRQKMARRPKFTDLAVAEAEAAREVDAFENANRALCDRLWKSINAATKETLKHQYEHNVISKQAYDHVKGMFKFYVPLRGFKEDTAEDIYSYYGKDISTDFANPLIKTKGRTTLAESPFGWIGSMAESAIQMDNKNDAKMRLYYFASNRPDQNLLTLQKIWYKKVGEDSDGKSIWEASYPKITPDMDHNQTHQEIERHDAEMKVLAASGLATQKKSELNLRNSVVNISDKAKPEHAITILIGGEERVMYVNGNPRAAQAINGMLNIDRGDSGIYRVLGQKITRWMAQLNTSYNPSFWISNYQRDLLFTIMGINVKEDKDYQKLFWSNYTNPAKVTQLLRKYEKGELDMSNPIEKAYKEFADNGGVTGYTVLANNEEYDKLLEKYARDAERSKFLKGAKNAFGAIQDFGEGVEQASRFAVYITSRQLGRPIEQAIGDAKEVTVNFNRKGSGREVSWEETANLSYGRYIDSHPKLKWCARVLTWMVSGLAPAGRSAYMFFNASIQGLRLFLSLYKKHPKKMAMWSGAYFGLSLALVGLNHMINEMLGGDDDDYLDIPDWERRNNILIGGGGFYLKWSIPQEVRPIYALADIIYNKLAGRSPDEKLYEEIPRALFEVLPVNPLGEGGFIRNIMPSVATPIFDIIANTDYKGMPLYRESYWSTGEEPKYDKAFTSTGKVFVEISRLLNNVTGGDYAEAGAINIHPAAIEHIIEGYGGGTVTFFNQLLKTLTGNYGEGEWMVRNTPFLNRVVTVNDERYRNSHTSDLFKYYESLAKETKRIYSIYKSNDDVDKVDELMDQKRYEIMRIYEGYRKREERYDDLLRDAEDERERREIMAEQDEMRRDMIKEISELP